MTPFWIWLTIAVVLAALEIVTPGAFFFLFLAAAAVVAGLSSLLLPTWWAQLAVFLVSGAAALMLAPRVARFLNRRTPGLRMNVDGLVDQVGVVQEAIDPVQGSGLIRVSGQMWRASAEEPIPAGKQVRVKAVEGTRLLVAPHISWEALLSEEERQSQQIQRPPGE